MLVRIISTKFFPISWTSPFTVAIKNFPFEEVFWEVSMNGSNTDTANFIVSADCNTKGNCIWPEPNKSPTTFIPSRRKVFIISRGLYFFSDLFNNSSNPIFSPSIIWFFNFSSRDKLSLFSPILFISLIDKSSNAFVNSTNGSYMHIWSLKLLLS